MRYIVITLLVVLIADQWLKIHIKTNYALGDEINIIGNWFRFHFTENPGMAFGWDLGGSAGKILLTLFRLVASGIIVYYLRSLIKEGAKLSLIFLVSLVLAGALGNILDSLFYGIIFNASTYHSVATFMPESGGYAPILMGKVVDMLYFPVLDTFWPDWVPFIGGNRLQFFRPVFNIADAAISIGVAIIIAFRKGLFAHLELEEDTTEQDN
ncbi:MAG: lipoprotein signal peptidase [Bacteroidia bacterium]